MYDEFEMSMMGKLNFFLGLQIKQVEDKVFFNQSKYVKEMLKKFWLEDSKPTKTPMSSKIKLTKDDEADSVDSSKYRGMIGSLLYLTASMPDIMFSVCLCARFQENPKTTHLEVVKRIFRYIRGTSHLGLWFPKDTRIETVVYADFDHAGDYVDRKSTSGVCTFMRCCLTSWFTKKQMAIIISTTEAEYVSARKACQKALWMKQALIDYGIRLDDVPIMCDKKGAIDIKQTYGEAMINSINNGDQPLPRVTQVSIAGTTSTEQPPSKDKSMWFDQEKRVQKIDRLYATMMKQNKNLMDINIDALYNILKQNQGDVNDAMGSKKKTVVVTSDPLALIAEKTNVSRSKEKVLYLWTLKEVKPMILMS
nr:hypothetical protein [Tanacetum cinerariifolium]